MHYFHAFAPVVLLPEQKSDAELELQSVPSLENTLLLAPTSLHLPLNPLSAPHSLSAPSVRTTLRLCTLPSHHFPEPENMPWLPDYKHHLGDTP